MKPRGNFEQAIYEMKAELEIVAPACDHIIDSNLNKETKVAIIKTRNAYELAITCLEYCKDLD
jgi:hypothetical protein